MSRKRHHRQDDLPAQAPREQPDLGPRRRARTAQTNHHRTGHAGPLPRPHSPWQRGWNESANGLPCRHLPEGTDLSVYLEGHLDAVAEELNDRPRKTLGFMEPGEKIVEPLDATN